MSAFFSRVAGLAVSRRGAVVAATVFITLIGTIAALRLETDADADTLFNRGSDTYAATQRLHQLFGDEAIPILVQGDLRNIVLTSNLGQLLALEGCLSGNLPQNGKPAAPVCQEIADAGATRAVYGPATFLNQSAIQASNLLSQRAQAAVAQARATAADAVAQARKQGYRGEDLKRIAEASAQEVLQNFQGDLYNLALQTGQTGPPRIDDPRFVSAVVFDSSKPEGTPRQDLNSFFPSPNAAQITVRLEPNLSTSEREHAIDLIRQAVASPRFNLHNASYVVSGVPIVIENLASEFRGEIFILLAAALAVMAIVLALVFEPPLRLLPLGLALVATAVTFGVLSLTGGSLTMASIAVLPVLIGLSVDYAIQFQARYREALASGDGPGPAARSAAARGGPVIGTAALATSVGFLVLLLSPIPMVRGFGILLVVGIALAFLAALTTGLAVLSAPRGKTRGRQVVPAAVKARLPKTSAVGDGVGRVRARGAGFARRASTRAIATAIARPQRVLLISIALAVGGWIASTQTKVVSDLRDLVPDSVLSDSGVDQLQSATGVSGELNVLVDAPDITDPAVVSWMGDLKSRILADGGYSGTDPSCQAAQICPYVFITDLLNAQGASGPPSQKETQTLLKALPAYFLQAFIAPQPASGGGGKDGSTAGFSNTANLSFGIRVMPLDEQKQLIDSIRGEINPPGIDHDPPAGVTATVAGIPALAADANSQLSHSRYWLTLICVAAVALVLLAVYRSLEHALVPLIPIVLATGWAALLIELTQIPLNPMSATLGALVVAIATEFSVILSARYREERGRGLSVGEALRVTYSRTGAAVLASGITAIAGFAVLPIADPIERIFGGGAIPMLTDFGLVTVVDLVAALLGVMIVLPAALVWAEGRSWKLSVPPLRGRTGVSASAPARRGVRGG